MRRLLSLAATSALVIPGFSFAATPAPLTYTTASGASKSVVLVSGVSDDGTPDVQSYIGPDGKAHSPVVQEQICSVENGTPYLCEAAGSTTDSALTLNDYSAPVSAGSWPTSDPLVAGQAWQSNGVMMLSTGSAAAPTFDGSYLNVTAGGVTGPLGNRLSALINSISNSNSTANKANSNAIAAQTAANSAATAAAAAQTTANAAIPLTQKGAASGVASLDANGNMTAPILSNSAGQTGALQVNGQINAQGIGYFINSTAQIQGIISGTSKKWIMQRGASDTFTTLNTSNGTTTQTFKYGDDGTFGATAVSAPSITATTSASVPDTSTTDSSTAALNTESAASRFETIDATTTALSDYLKSSDAASTYLTIADASAKYVSSSALASYLTTSDAAATYAPLASPALTGTPTAPTPATTDNSTNVATTAYVNNAFQSVEYSVQGDISTSGSSIQIPFGTSGLYAKFAYTGSGSASMTFYSTSGTLSPVDIRRNSIWGGSGVETYTLDNGSVGTAGVVADSTVYTQSNDSSAYFIRVGGTVYFLTVWASNSGARAFMGVHKMI